MLLWVVREQQHDYGPGAEEHLREGGNAPYPLTLGVFSTLALARAALAMRLANLYAGGDCFTAPCPDRLYVVQRWRDDDGTGEMCITVRPRANPAPPYYGQYDDSSTLTLTIETQQADQPTPLDRRPSCWEAMEDAAGFVRPAPPPPPPPTAEQVAARAALYKDLPWLV
jgi:hypothetical protein